jgi:hypothetical protein
MGLSREELMQDVKPRAIPILPPPPGPGGFVNKANLTPPSKPDIQNNWTFEAHSQKQAMMIK